ncbi:MAG: hypothetical protein JW894_09015 [Bacteroidales bacterium]|nr:hypothetical protein [Bacteroidales bacterium]
MKKFLIITAIVLLAIPAVNAQEPSGNFAVDFNFDPAAIFDANAGPMFQMPYIKGRYFLSSKTALRVGFDFGFGSSKDYEDPDGDDYTKMSSANFSLAAGIEKQFGTDKFRAYVGGELPISVYRSSSEVSIADNTIESTNPYGDDFFGIGLAAVVGFDYYILPALYVGAEFSPGFAFIKYRDQEVDNDVIEKGGNGFGFNISSASGVRIGVRF